MSRHAQQRGVKALTRRIIAAFEAWWCFKQPLLLGLWIAIFR